MKLVDTHCHLYSEEFTADIDEVITKAKQVGIERFYLPAIDSTAHKGMLQLEEKYPGTCIAMMGLHPCYVKENYKEELAIVEEWINKRNFVAIGEIGLDFYWDTNFSQQQYEAFNMQMQWALDKKRPIVIHTRNAMRETIAAVKPFADKGLRGIFHCFGGTVEDANTIIEMGFYLGIGGIITYKNNTLSQVLKDIPLDYLVLETDAPYLPPVPYRGKRNESSYLQFINTKLAEVKQISEEEVATITSANADKIFSF
jgi:TatD DNase family protein